MNALSAAALKDLRDGMTPQQRRLLHSVVTKWKEETREIERRPSWVRGGYFAFGPERRTARRLHQLGLLHASSEWHSTGVTLYPSDVALQLYGLQAP